MYKIGYSKNALEVRVIKKNGATHLHRVMAISRELISLALNTFTTLDVFCPRNTPIKPDLPEYICIFKIRTMTYKYFCFFSLFFLIVKRDFAQMQKDSLVKQGQLVGVWQVGSNVVSSTLQANFRFYKSGKYIYNVSGYADLNPLYSISGNYKLQNGALLLNVVSYKKLDGFKIVESSPGFQSGVFVLDGGKIVTITQTDSSYNEHQLQFVKGKKEPNYSIISIDNEKYYKVTDDPNRFVK